MHLFFLLFLFFFETSYAKTETFVDEPQGCYQKKKFPCSIQVTGRTFDHIEEKVQISLTKNSVFTFNKDQSIKLIEGSLWIISNEYKVQLPYAVVTGSGEALFTSEYEKSWIANLNSQMTVEGIGKGPTPFLLNGTQVWMGSLDSNNIQAQGMVEVVEVKNILTAAALHSFTRKKIKTKLDLWKPSWAESKTKMNEIYKEVAQRKIASVEEKDRQKTEARRRIQLENQELKRLFREKNFVD